MVMNTLSEYYLKPISWNQPSVGNHLLFYLYFCSLVLVKTFINFKLLHNDFETKRSELLIVFASCISYDKWTRSWLANILGWHECFGNRGQSGKDSLCPRWAVFAAVEVRFRIVILIFYGNLLLCAMWKWNVSVSVLRVSLLSWPFVFHVS